MTEETVKGRLITTIDEAGDLKSVREYAECTFEGLDLSRFEWNEAVVFKACSFININFKCAVLADALFEKCEFEEVSFSFADLRGAAFTRCRGQKTAFEGAKLNRVVFFESDFCNSRFVESNLFAAEFKNCKLTGADFAGANTTGWNVEKCVLRYANLRFHSFNKTVVNGIDFCDADLADCNFSNSSLEGCTLTNANLQNANFKNADLRESNLIGFNITNCKSLKGAKISPDQAALLLYPYGIEVE